MTTQGRDLVGRLRRAGLRVGPGSNGKLLVQAFPGKATAKIRQQLLKHKAEILAWQDSILDLRLDRFEQARCGIGIQIPGIAKTVWWVGSRREVEILAQQGVQRGQIWTVEELKRLLQLPGLDPEIVGHLVLAKIGLNCELISMQADANRSHSRRSSKAP